MKITAEFNSNEELMSFISTFGAKSYKADNTAQIINIPVKAVEPVEATEKQDKSSAPLVNVDIVSQEVSTGKVIDADINKEIEQEQRENETPKVTKEMIREKLGAIMKAGKQKEVKDLVAKYGAAKVPDLKEEDYAAVYEEAEGLL